MARRWWRTSSCFRDELFGCGWVGAEGVYVGGASSSSACVTEKCEASFLSSERRGDDEGEE